MQTAYNYCDFKMNSRKVTTAKGFRFTDRELDILEFITEMKFSTLECIHSKFFKVTKWGSQSNSLTWARQRLLKLIQSDLVQVMSDVCTTPLYVVTPKGFNYLRSSRLHHTFCKPLYEVDGRFFDHDCRVTKVRIQLENLKMTTKWISERQLSEIELFKQSLSSEFRPDAIYTDNEGRKVAFELEIARKAKVRYQTKIKRYIQVMEDPTQSKNLFERVHFVCEKKNILELLKLETALYQHYFTFSLESEIMAKEIL